MAADSWRPLSRRDDPSYQGPYEGVPKWLQSSLLDWIERGLKVGSLSYNTPVLQQAERKLRFHLDWTGMQFADVVGELRAFQSLQAKVLANDVLFLDVVDFLLSKEVNSGRVADLVGAWRKEDLSGR